MCLWFVEEKPKYVAPSFSQTPQDVAVDAGATATFTTKVSGEPQPEVMWYVHYIGIPS